VLDTKWKLLDSSEDNIKNKYGLSQADFYQLYAYGEYYLPKSNTKGSVVLIYPKTDSFKYRLEVFNFKNKSLRLFVIPYDLEHNKLVFERG